MSRVYFYVVDGSGTILRQGVCQDIDGERQASGEGEVSVVLDAPAVYTDSSGMAAPVSGATHTWSAATQAFTLIPPPAAPPAPPPPSLDALRASKLQALADARWTASASFSYGGHAAVSSDDTAQSRLNATLTLLSLPGAPSTVSWEIEPGVYEGWGLSDLQAFAAAMGSHVQACWSRAQAISAEIMAAGDADALATISTQVSARL